MPKPHTSSKSRFIDMIVSDPEDLSIREVYSDYLQEIGDPRGEFIALQCAKSRQKYPDFDLLTRELELLEKHGEEFLREDFPELGKQAALFKRNEEDSDTMVVEYGPITVKFTNGFVSELASYKNQRIHMVLPLSVCVDTSSSAKVAQFTPSAIHASNTSEPYIQFQDSLESGYRGLLKALTLSPVIPIVKTFKWSVLNSEIEALASFLQNPKVRVREFMYTDASHVPHFFIHETLTPLFQATSMWESVEVVSLNSVLLSTHTLHELKSTSMPNLRTLKLRRSGRPMNLEPLYDLPKAPNLKTLSLQGNRINFESFCEFLHKASYPKLKILDVSKNRIDRGDQLPLRRSRLVSKGQLEVLDIRKNPVCTNFAISHSSVVDDKVTGPWLLEAVNIYYETIEKAINRRRKSGNKFKLVWDFGQRYVGSSS